MLTLHIEAGNHLELTRQAIRELGLAAVEGVTLPAVLGGLPAPASSAVAAEGDKAPTPAPAAVTAEPAAVATPAPVVGDPVPQEPQATLPTPAARNKPGRKAKVLSPAAPVAIPPAPAAAVFSEPTSAATAITDFLAPTAPVVQPSTPAVSKEISNDEIRYALGEVNGKFGMVVCTELIEQTGVDRISLVPQEKRAAFIAACKAVLTQADADTLVTAAAVRAKAKQQAKAA